jgi:excisionase family DNA binding protein
MTELYTVKQVADKFEVHPETIRRLAKSGDLPARKIGNEWRFSEKTYRIFWIMPKLTLVPLYNNSRVL